MSSQPDLAADFAAMETLVESYGEGVNAEIARGVRSRSHRGGRPAPWRRGAGSPTCSSAFHREGQREAGHGLGAEEPGHRRDDLDRQILPLARDDGLLDEIQDLATLMDHEVDVVLGALDELRPHVLEDDGDPAAGLARRLQCDQRGSGIGSSAERAEVHRAQVIARAPGERHDDLAAFVGQIEDPRPHIGDQPDLRKRPEAQRQCLPDSFESSQADRLYAPGDGPRYMLREGIMKRALAAMMVLFAVSGCRTTRVTVARLATQTPTPVPARPAAAPA